MKIIRKIVKPKVKRQVIILDANSLITRNIMASALGDLKADDDTITGGIYGTLTAMRAIVGMPELYRTVSVVAFFDRGVPPFRKQLFEQYKKARKEKRKERFSDDEVDKLFAQIPKAQEMLKLLGVTCTSFIDREADDCVVAAVRVANDMGYLPIVVSGDKDLWQSVVFGAEVWDLNKKVWLTYDTFEESTGVHPKLYLVYKALIGDPADGIPGVGGVGEKRALELCQTFRGEMLDCANYISSMERLANLLSAQTASRKLKKFEQAIIDNIDWMRSVLKGIDLSDSFGSLKVVKSVMDRTSGVDDIGFLRFCKKVKFGSVLGNPQKFLNPFKEVQKRRSSADTEIKE